MTDYLIFIDTEASGLPVCWTLPISAIDNWPHAVQVSWLIYDKNQQLVKQEDYYICVEGFTVAPSAIETHGLTPGFLNENGKPAGEVMQLLAADLLHFKPMVIGHFVRMDYYVLSADLHRLNIDNPLENLPVFCTMVATRYLRQNLMARHLRLDELYNLLFQTQLQDQHNALADAKATADCFFELLNLGEINPRSIAAQNAAFEQQRNPAKKAGGCAGAAIMMIILLAILLIYSL